MKHVFGWVFMLTIVTAFSGCSKQVEMIGHRGASYLAPENTMASVMLGWEKNADVEVDIYLSKDNRVMVIHDKTTKRTGGEELKVAESTSAQLRKLEYGSFKSPEFAGEPIPFLEDIVDTIPAGRKLYVEIKCGTEVLPYLKDIIDKSGKRDRVVIICFDLDVSTEAKKLMGLPTYWLRGTRKVKDTEELIMHDPAWVQTVIEHGLDGLDVHYAGITQEFMDAVNMAGQKLYVWTVDEPEDARRMVQFGVTGITTNRPGWLRGQLKNGSAGE